MRGYDVVVVGAGPNGLACGIALAGSGLSVALIEASDGVGGGLRSAELTRPGFVHDVCSAIHPMALASPFFRELPLTGHGVEWRFTPLALAHPMDDGSAGVLATSIDTTTRGLGPDGTAWRRLLGPLADDPDRFFGEILRPVAGRHRHPLLLARFGLSAVRSATAVAGRFGTDRARALFGGCAAHAAVPLERAGSAAFGLVLAAAGHAVGWPCAQGGSAAIGRALAAIFESYGGDVRLRHRVSSMRDLPPSRAVVFDLTPRQLARIAADALPSSWLGRLSRFRYGPGVFKVDWALHGPIPWRAPECRIASTVHVGGTLEEIAAHERGVWQGRAGDRPFVIVAQQSLADATRAPAGRHTGWAYCHVPNGSPADMTGAIESQIERFAPGFRDLILARHTMGPAAYEQHDENFVGGDIGGGANTLFQTLARPLFARDPYATPNPRLFLGSSSTPPGGGVHGMCGYWAARSVLGRVFGRELA